jgi:uncharacterized protein YgbK (DUF1537 family)
VVGRLTPPRRRDPMTSLSTSLADVTRADTELRAAEDDLDRARQAFREALQAAQADGASLAQLGTLTGRSRQRIAQLIRGD